MERANNEVNFFMMIEVYLETGIGVTVFNVGLNSHNAQPFHVLGPSHVTVLSLTIIITILMIRAAWRGESWGLRSLEKLLALVLLSEWPANILISWVLGELDVDHIVPAHFCDVASILGGLALLTRKHELCELLYFWGLSGTAQGLLTPALEVDFPSPRFLVFFALHSGVVIAALYIVFGKRITPRAGAVKRAMGWMLVYAAVAAMLNVLLGSNYGFLCHKPPTGSLLDMLGPWPWYVGSLVLVALVFFTALDLPFRGRRGD